MKSNNFRAVILYSVAEYCDHSTKLTIKLYGKKVKTELWTSEMSNIDVTTIKYKTRLKAWTKYKLFLAESLLGGWKVLNLFPERETWETKRSK